MLGRLGSQTRSPDFDWRKRHKLCGAFRDGPATKTHGAFRGMPQARTGETPCIQHRHLGALIADCDLSLWVRGSPISNSD